MKENSVSLSYRQREGIMESGKNMVFVLIPILLKLSALMNGKQ
jgi:hypothetical protein